MNRYKGISFPFRFNARGGVAVSSSFTAGAEHIQESVYQILSTEPGDRVLEPYFGCKLRDIIFEPIDITVISIIKDRVRRALLMWEKRIELDLNSIEVKKVNNSTVNLHVGYSVLTGNYSAQEIVVPYRR